MDDKPVLLYLVYRRPGSNFESFLNDYEGFLSSNSHRKCLIFGDINIDLLKFDDSTIVRRFVYMNYEYNFFALVNKPTRVGCVSATVIDHIWCNFVDKSRFKTGILPIDVSDHFGVLLGISGPELNPSPPKCFTYRSWTNIDNGVFYRDFCSKIPELDIISLDHGIDKALDDLSTLIHTSIEEVCPLKSYTLSNNFHKPWINPEIRQLIKEKNKLYRKYIWRPITYDSQYKSCRNRLNNMTKFQIKIYFQSKLSSCENDSKKKNMASFERGNEPKNSQRIGIG